MPIALKRPDGSVTHFINSEYLPLYYFIPASILSKCGKLANSLPRNPSILFRDWTAISIVESDFFLNLIMDATAYTVWPYMGMGEYMEIYSGYEPSYVFAHSAAIWAKAFMDIKLIPTANEMFLTRRKTVGFMEEEFLKEVLSILVPQIMAKYKMDQVLAVVNEYRCFEDFDFRDSNRKTDFYRKWYHTRTQHPQISLEGFQEDYAQQHNGEQWDIPDPSQNVEESVTSELLVEEFKATLSEKDMQILQMRLEGHTLEEIAQALGYKNHSGVQKRIRKIGQAYERFVGVDYGFGGIDG